MYNVINECALLLTTRAVLGKKRGEGVNTKGEGETGGLRHVASRIQLAITVSGLWTKSVTTFITEANDIVSRDITLLFCSLHWTINVRLSWLISQGCTSGSEYHPWLRKCDDGARRRWTHGNILCSVGWLAIVLVWVHQTSDNTSNTSEKYWYLYCLKIY